MSEINAGPTTLRGTFMQVRQKRKPSWWMQSFAMGLSLARRTQLDFSYESQCWLGALVKGSAYTLIPGGPASPSP